MQNNSLRNILVLATVAVALLSAVALIPFSDADSEEREIDDDLGDFWSYTIGFGYTGEGALEVTWDFGDGSEPVTAWSVVHDYPVSHTYENPGVYYVTQTAINAKGPSEAVYKVTVLGYPFIDFESNGGSTVERIQMTSGGRNAVAAEEPAEPTKDGFYFVGWFTDESCTQPYDWSQPVTEGITLYAGWSETPVEDVPGGDDSGDSKDDGSGTDWTAVGIIIVGAIIAIISLLAITAIGLIGGIGALAGVIIVIAGIAKLMGVF